MEHPLELKKSRLKIVDLSGIQIKNPEDIPKLIYLQSLSLPLTLLSTAHPKLDSSLLGNIKTLILEGCGLTTFRGPTLVSLEYLNLADNHINEPRSLEVHDFAYLINLNLSGNDIVGGLTTILRPHSSIEWLTLDNNYLTHLDIGIWPRLRRLVAKGNQINTLENFGTQPALESLLLDWNVIPTLVDLELQPQLLELSVRGNHLTTLEDLVIHPTLIETDVRDNHLKSVACLDNFPNLIRVLGWFESH
jgi:hypothetical protein